jgi:flagellar motor switch protein FliG
MPVIGAAKMDYRSVAKRLLQEHPQTIAVVLARLQTENSSEVMKLLPAFVQADLMNRIVQIDHLSKEVLVEIDTLMDSLR